MMRGGRAGTGLASDVCDGNEQTYDARKTVLFWMVDWAVDRRERVELLGGNSETTANPGCSRRAVGYVGGDERRPRKSRPRFRLSIGLADQMRGSDESSRRAGVFRRARLLSRRRHRLEICWRDSRRIFSASL